MNILGIDYGLKSVGFAVGEQITNSCSTYFSKKFKNRKELVEKIKNLITEWDINTIVIGLPLNMDNSESEMSLEIRNFSKKLFNTVNDFFFFSLNVSAYVINNISVSLIFLTF